MTKVKSINDHSWLLLDQSQVGLLSRTNQGSWVLVQHQQQHQFATQESLVNFLKFDPFAVVSNGIDAKNVKSFVKGFPTNRPQPLEVYHNSSLPLFAKRKNTKVWFCAGYYAVWSTTRWREVFCPKWSTLCKKRWHGPFVTANEVKQILKDLNQKQ